MKNKENKKIKTIENKKSLIKAIKENKEKVIYKTKMYKIMIERSLGIESIINKNNREIIIINNKELDIWISPFFTFDKSLIPIEDYIKNKNAFISIDVINDIPENIIKRWKRFCILETEKDEVKEIYLFEGKIT